MTTKEPKSINEYKIWLKNICGTKNLVLLDESDYIFKASKIKNCFERSDLWTQLIKNLNSYNDEYSVNNFGYKLLMPVPQNKIYKPGLIIKPYESFLPKTFRKNVLENKSWPNEPKDGWILPNNWYSRIDDVVRTTFFVKYINGVEFLKNKIDSLCKTNNKKYDFSLKAKEEGYYAAHLYITERVEIPKMPWGTETVSVQIEIKITTQIKEVIQKLLHGYYEKKRMEAKMIKKKDVKWQWDYRSNEFNVNYLGHIIHYIEGVIINVRDKQNN